MGFRRFLSGDLRLYMSTVCVCVCVSECVPCLFSEAYRRKGKTHRAEIEKEPRNLNPKPQTRNSPSRDRRIAQKLGGIETVVSPRPCGTQLRYSAWRVCAARQLRAPKMVGAGGGGFEGGSLHSPAPFSFGVCACFLRGHFAFCPPAPHPWFPLHLLAPPLCVSIPALGAVVASISRNVARARTVPLLHSARMSSLVFCAEGQLLGHAGAPALARTIGALQCAQEASKRPHARNRCHSTGASARRREFGSASFCWQALGAAHCHNARKAILRAVWRRARAGLPPRIRT